MAHTEKGIVLRSLANVIRRAGLANSVTVIAKAKVPIVKFVTLHELGGFSVDISINQGNGVTAGKVVTGFLRSMRNEKALKSLVFITKMFLSQRSLNEVYSGGLGSYSIVCLAISFLQMHPKVRSGEIDADQNLGVLVIEFFEFYGRYFNYRETGISLVSGGTYYNKKERGFFDSRRDYLLSIEDPIDECTLSCYKDYNDFPLS
jgi:non-canonical poly(A) RNA polymerase PAPD5/7